MYFLARLLAKLHLHQKPHWPNRFAITEDARLRPKEAHRLVQILHNAVDLVANPKEALAAPIEHGTTLPSALVLIVACYAAPNGGFSDKQMAADWETAVSMLEKLEARDQNAAVRVS